MSKRLPILLLAILFAVTGASLHYRFGFFHHDRGGAAIGSDDAFISFRYAANLLRHGELTFNLGQRVEGISNLMFTAAIASIAKATQFDNFYLISFGLNLVCLALFLTIFQRLSCLLIPKQAKLAVVLLALTPNFWLWSGSGLESIAVVTLQAGLLFSACSVIQEPKRKESTAWLLSFAIFLVLIRPDGFLSPSIVGAYFFATGARRHGLLILGTTALSLVLLSFWRESYYGSAIPNVFYAKVAGTLAQRFLVGVSGFSGVVLGSALVIWLPAMLTCAARILQPNVARTPLHNQLGLLLFFSSVWIAYFVSIGGDCYHERFLLFLFPIGIICVLSDSELFENPRHMKWSRRLLPCLLAFFCLVTPFLLDSRFRWQSNKFDRWYGIGLFLKRNYPPNSILAADAIGKVSYLTDFPTIDMWGLTDPHIAQAQVDFLAPGHSKNDPEYVMSLHPDVLMVGIDEALNLNCSIGHLYEKLGYQLHFLAWCPETPRLEPIKDVSSLESWTLTRLIQQGYCYAVLDKPK